MVSGQTTSPASIINKYQKESHMLTEGRYRHGLCLLQSLLHLVDLCNTKTMLEKRKMLDESYWERDW